MGLHNGVTIYHPQGPQDQLRLDATEALPQRCKGVSGVAGAEDLVLQETMGSSIDFPMKYGGFMMLHGGVPANLPLDPLNVAMDKLILVARVVYVVFFDIPSGKLT